MAAGSGNRGGFLQHFERQIGHLTLISLEEASSTDGQLRRQADFHLYLERGIKDSLASGSTESREREIALLSRAQLSLKMKTSEFSLTPEDGAVAVSQRRSFPLRTLMICFTIWLVATEILIFDQIKFNVRAELVEQATRAIHGSRLLVPTERPSNLPGDTKMEKL